MVVSCGQSRVGTRMRVRADAQPYLGARTYLVGSGDMMADGVFPAMAAAARSFRDVHRWWRQGDSGSWPRAPAESRARRAVSASGKHLLPGDWCERGIAEVAQDVMGAAG